MIRASAIDQIALAVGDLEASTKFYRDVLGLTLARVRPEIGMNHLRIGSSMIDLVSSGNVLGKREGGWSMGGLALDHICLRVEHFDPEAARRELAALGIKTEKPALRYGAEGEAQSLYFQNSDGHRLELTGGAQT